MVKEETLRALVHEFQGRGFIPRRREWFDIKLQKNILPLLQEDMLSRLTVEDANRIYNQMTVGGPKLYPNTFIQNGVERIKKSLDYLLYSKDPLEDRFFNVADNLDSDYRLNGTNRAFASTALLIINPKEYGVWNGAVDGGLRMLGLLPEKKRGENKGQRYIRIIKALRELQQKCGFEDLSITDEFVEKLSHREIGTGIVTEEPIEEEAIVEEDVTPTAEDPHLRIQWMLIKIGKWEGHDIWVASNDYGKEYKGDKFSSLCLAELPIFGNPEALRIARSIDVIWFRKRSTRPIHFFEIEHTTSIYSGLLRLNDVKIDYDVPKATIVAPGDRKRLFETQINRRTFVYSTLADVCEFMDYNDVENLFKAEKVRSETLGG